MWAVACIVSFLEVVWGDGVWPHQTGFWEEATFPRLVAALRQALLLAFCARFLICEMGTLTGASESV